MKFPFGSNPWAGLAVGVVLGLPLGYIFNNLLGDNPQVGMLAGWIVGIPVGYYATYLYGRSQQRKDRRVSWSVSYGTAQAQFEGPSESEQSGQMLEVMKAMTSAQQARQLPGSTDTEAAQ